jgi:predicted nucleic acid-binding protein
MALRRWPYDPRASFARCRGRTGDPPAANGEIDSERGRAALADLADFPLHRYPHDFLLSRVWDLWNNLTVYDAVYIALAEALDAPLLTRDRRLAAAAGHHAQITLA